MAFLGRESKADVERAERLKRWVQARSPLALFSVLLGVVAVVDFFTLVLGVALGAAAMVLGVLGLRELRIKPAMLGHRLCYTGIALGALAWVLSAAFYFCVIHGA